MAMIEPFYDRVVLERLVEEKTQGGLIIANSDANCIKAVVVAVGPGKFDMTNDRYLEPPVKVGDVVIINDRLGARITLERGGPEYLIQGFDELFGKEKSE